MTIISGTDRASRLREGITTYERTVDHYEKWFVEIQEDFDFLHSRQWKEQDEQWLRRQNRPVLTYNIIHAKMNHMLGTLLDNVRTPYAAPVCMEDKSRADVVEYLRSNLYRDLGVEMYELEAFETGGSVGICSIALDVVPSELYPDRMDLVLTPCGPFEILWDPGSDMKDKSDAGYNIWSRWMTVPEFKQEWPEHAGEIQQIMNTRFSDVGIEFADRGGAGITEPTWRWDYRPKRETLYYDRRRNMIRVVRIEYLVSEKETTLFGPDGSVRTVPARVAKQIQGQFPGQFGVEERWVKKTRWLEFVGHLVLFDDYRPIPLSFPFSAIPFVAYADDRNYPYGKVRLMKDPQMEVNKRMSQTLNLVNTQIQPGVIAEEDAFVDEDEAEVSLKTPGSITWAKAGSLAQGKIDKREVPTFPDAIAKLADSNMRLFDMIAGVHADSMVEPRGIPEAAATTQLKHRQSLLHMSPILRRFWQFQRRLAHALIELAVKTFSDEQLTELIARGGQYVVQEGMAIDMRQVQAAQQAQQAGQQAPAYEPVPIRQVRDLKLNVELRSAEENETQRIMDLQVLMGVMQLGTPVDPEILFESLGMPKEKVERLKAYHAQIQTQEAQKGQAAMMMQMEQMKAEQLVEVLDRVLDAGKLREEVRSNQADELLEGMKLGLDSSAQLAELWARANEQQKELLARKMIEEIKARAQRERAAQGGGGSAAA